MASDGERKERGRLIRDVVIPIGISVGTGILCFVIGTTRAESAHEIQLDEIRLDIQKIRAMPEPDQVVTKDELTEIVKRLDERTQQISQDVQYLREREEKRAQ